MFISGEQATKHEPYSSYTNHYVTKMNDHALEKGVEDTVKCKARAYTYRSSVTLCMVPALLIDR